ncbi:MAG: hypothetical protein M1817_001963 [Caeruleum heppii]|nr:MAG: hypothetical protein M1817_001963 [Caeruleum heppii]
MPPGLTPTVPFRCSTFSSTRSFDSFTPLALRYHSTTPRHSFSSSSNAQLQSQAQKRRQRDPYAIAQARQRKAANVARQATLQAERAAAVGDPLLLKPTPFIKTLDYAIPPTIRPTVENAPSSDDTDPTAETTATENDATSEPYLNHFITAKEFQESIKQSEQTTRPEESRIRGSADPAIEAAELQKHEEQHEVAVTAMARMLSLANGSNKDRTRVHVQRCVETFGRHRTDEVLAPKPSADATRDSSLPEKTPRAGPDTGSPEVQIAILTTKIHALKRHLETTGKKDMVNKRNLQVLVHKRQKLLRYLRRKERGGERFQNVMDTLGLSDGAWMGEISLR